MKKLKLWWWFLVGLITLFVGFWVVADNPDLVQVTLMGIVIYALPLGVWMLILFGLGCSLGLLCGWPQLLRQKKRLNRLTRQLESLK